MYNSTTSHPTALLIYMGSWALPIARDNNTRLHQTKMLGETTLPIYDAIYYLQVVTLYSVRNYVTDNNTVFGVSIYMLQKYHTCHVML